MFWHKNYSLEPLQCLYEGIVYTEEWRSVDESGGTFQVSSFGRLKRLQRVNKISGTIRPEKIITQWDGGRYVKANMSVSGRLVSINTHRLVCKTFHENPEDKPQVNHKDAIKHNNFYMNLEWATQPENIQHAQSLGIFAYAKPKMPKRKPGKPKGCKGEFKPIIDLMTGIFWTSEDVSLFLGIKRRYVTRLLNEERGPNNTQYRYA